MKRMAKTPWPVIALAAVLVAASLSAGWTQEAESDRLELLNDKTVLRFFMAHKTPVVLTAGGEIVPGTVRVGKEDMPMRAFETPPPPASWTEPAFDDSAWSRERAPAETPAVSRGALGLAANTGYMGNTESMVKWIRTADGGYRHDFSAVDKYLDAVDRHMGKPFVVRLNVWAERTRIHRQVSLLDPATGQLEDLTDPATSNVTEKVAFWSPVLAGLRDRLERRGWLDVAAFGYTSYTADPPPEIVSLIMQMWEGAHGYKSSHGNANVWRATDKRTIPVIANDGVWQSGTLYDPDHARFWDRPYPTPWKNTARKMDLGFPREGVQHISLLRCSYSRLSYFRMTPESCLQGHLDGIGNVGADFWPLKTEDDRGRIRWHTQANQHQLGPGACLLAILSPGPDGPVGNERYEMFREGVQTTEAIIFLQKAVESGKLPDGMAERVRLLLDARARAYRRTFRGMWAPQLNWVVFEGGGRERDAELFDLCAEAAKSL